MKYDYFNLFFQAGEEGAVAYTIKKTEIGLVSELKGVDEFPIVFEIKEGVLQDYLANNKAWPLISERFKNIVDRYTTDKQHRWVRVKVKETQTNQTTIYFLPIFESKIDILNEEDTRYDENNLVLVPCLSLKKVRKLNIFPLQDPDFDLITSYLFVSKGIKEAIVKNKLTGMTFSRANLTNDVDEHFLELEKAWDTENFYVGTWIAANNETYNFLLSVDRYVREIKKQVLIWVRRVGVQAGFTPEDLEYEINELLEEEYNKNNLRRLFDSYHDEEEGRQKEVPLEEVIETLKGKTPIQDEGGKIRFLSLPDLLRGRTQALKQAALEIGKKLKSRQDDETADAIFEAYRKIKNQLIDLDQARQSGDELAQKKQQVKDEARILIEDFDRLR